MDRVLQDIRYSLRILFRAPGFTVVAVLTLAIGIGANVAVFSVVRGVLLRPLPYQDPDRLVQVFTAHPARAAEPGPFSPQDLDDLRRQQQVFSSFGAYWYSSASSGKTLANHDNPLHLNTAFADSGFFTTLGVAPTLGRTFNGSEDIHGNDGVAILSDRLWKQLFHGDRSIVGKTISLDGSPFVVAGVMPPSFVYPSREVDLWLPLAQMTDKEIPHMRQLRWMDAIGRLKPGISLAQAAIASSTIMKSLEQQYPDTNEGTGAAVVQELRRSVVGEVRPILLALLGAVALVLLIACANIANLVLARGTTRIREFAIRGALGASRARLRRQLFTESAVLAGLGGAASFVFAAWSTSALLALSANSIPRPDEIRTDGAVIFFGAALSILAGLLVGLIPALKLHGSHVWDSIKAFSTTTTTHGEHQRGRDVLIISEIALACVLLATSSLVLKSLYHLLNTDPGFDASHVLTVQLPLPLYKYDTPDKQGVYRAELLRRVASIPGVAAVGGSKTLPLYGGGEPYGFTATSSSGQTLQVSPTGGTYIVTQGYFEALRIPLRFGRFFAESDLAEKRRAVVVNHALAQTYWPGENAVGRFLYMGKVKLEIIGVVGDVRNEGLSTPTGPAVYIPSSMAPRAKLNLFVRSEGEPLSLAASVRRAIVDFEPDQAITDISPLQQEVQDTVAQPRFFTIVLSTFGTVALLLAVLGIFGVISYMVRQRTREIGIRMALGASKAVVLGMVLRRATKLLVIGASLGVAGALASGRLLASLLYGVRATDPLAIAAAVAVLAAAAFLAATVPAFRATRIEPVTALRYE
jgi:predicted permease